MSIAIKIIQPKFNLAKLTVRDEIFNVILREVKKICHLTEPTDLHLIEYICTLIENLVIKKDNINKEILITDILAECFPSITEEQIALVKKGVLYLLNSKRIKKIPLLKYAVHLSRELVGFFLLNVKKI